MNITEMIKRLEEIKSTCGNLPVFFFKRDYVRPITHPEIIAISGGNSSKVEDGLYFRVPEDDEPC